MQRLAVDGTMERRQLHQVRRDLLAARRRA